MNMMMFNRFILMLSNPFTLNNLWILSVINGINCVHDKEKREREKKEN